MLAQTNGSSFFLRKSQNPKDKLFYVYQRVTINGKPKEWSIKRKWDPKRWITKSGRASDNKEDAKALNAYLDSLCSKALRAQKLLMDNDKDLTGDALKNAVKGVSEKSKLLLDEFQTHNDEMFELVGIADGYAKGTHDRFVTAMGHTRAFIKFKYNKEDIALKSLDLDFIKSYYRWLRTIRKCSHNTSVKYITNMKKVVIKFITNGYLKGDPFAGFGLTIKEVKKPFLTLAELKSVMDKEFSTFRLSFVRDIFVFSCFTGLAYADVKKLKSTDIFRIEGFDWIVTPRTKTKVEAHIPILPQAQAILDKYANHERTIATGKPIPVFTNQKVNEYLKEIAAICNINKVMTFHTARHTFATTVTLRYGISLPAVQAMLGHKNPRQTRHYANVQQEMIGEEMKELVPKLTGLLAEIKQGA